MKKYLFAVCLIISVSLKAQYKAISNGDSISWHIVLEIPDGVFPIDCYLSDTITVENVLYQKTIVYYSENNQHLLGYFREDTILGKAWFRGVHDTSEYLVMDLSLSIGDSVLVKQYPADEVYSKVTDIRMENNRKILTLDYRFGGGFISENLEFIEGIGPNASVLFQLDEESWDLVYNYGSLLCKTYHNSDLIYAWDTINHRCTRMVNAELRIKEDIKFFPNPTCDKIYTIDKQITKIELLDINGSRLKVSYGSELDLTGNNSGIYFLRFVNKNNESIYKKVILINGW